jgi:hypothetical protein
MSVDPAVTMALRTGLALLLAASALAKLREPAAFAGAVAGYRLVPRWLAKPAAAGFALAEGVLAVALCMPTLQVAAAAGVAGLLALYTLAIAWNLLRGRRDIDCGCGGPLGRRRISEALVARNAVLIAAALATALPVLPRPLVWLDAWTVLAALTSGALLYAATEALFTRPVAS